MKKSVFASDLYRYYGERGETVKDRLLRPIELQYFIYIVPDHAIVIGNPAKIIHRDSATEGYIEKTV